MPLHSLTHITHKSAASSSSSRSTASRTAPANQQQKQQLFTHSRTPAAAPHVRNHSTRPRLPCGSPAGHTCSCTAAGLRAAPPRQPPAARQPAPTPAAPRLAARRQRPRRPRLASRSLRAPATVAGRNRLPNRSRVSSEYHVVWGIFLGWLPFLSTPSLLLITATICNKVLYIFSIYTNNTSLEFVTLLGDESKILCGDSSGATSLYDADSHSIMTMHGLRASKGQDAIPISINRTANDHARQYDSLYVMNRTPDSDIAEYLLEELRYGSEDLFSDYPLIHRWKSLPPPPFIYHPAYEIPADIAAYAVVGSTIYVSSAVSGIGTYSFDTLKWAWRHAGEWMLPFYGKAEYVPELNLWFGLSSSWPFHLCAADLSALDFQQPPTVQHTWVDLDFPKNWEPLQLDFINLGSGRFCTVKTFLGTRPPMEVGFSDNEDDGNESIDLTDVIDWEFAVLTGIEVVRSCNGESPESVRMIKHKSRFYICADHSIKWVL
ncbi:unnamed protein product [Urochloa humidicola]